MDYQSLGRHQRPKGSNIKQGLQLMLILTVCAWLVYQIKNPRVQTQKYGVQTKLGEEYRAVSLGRKGTPSWWTERALPIPNSGNAHSVEEAEKTTNGRDNVFDGATDDEDEEEFGHIDEKVTSNEGKEVKKESEKQSKVSPKNKYKDSSKENSEKVESKQKERGNEKYPERPVIINDVQMRKTAKVDGSIKENGEDEGTKIGEKVDRKRENGVDGVHSFHDENGVPPDGNETEPIGGQAHNLHEQTISKFSKETRVRESNIYELTSGEDNDAKMTLEDSTIDATADAEINSGSSSHVDTSGTNLNSETGAGDSLDL